MDGNNNHFLNNVLLHICCGVCAAYPVQKLREDGHMPLGFFYNPNIYPEPEYLKRLDTARRCADLLEMELLVGEYDTESWYGRIAGLEKEPEGGKRCEACFRLRLEATDRKRRELGIPLMATTLSVSPHKDTDVINFIARSLDGSSFLEYDFKKDGGFEKTHSFAKQNGLYCQNYCGCEYSMR